MRHFGKRKHPHSELEDELRANRPEPSDEFLRTTAKRVGGRERRFRPGFGLNPVYGVTLVALVVLIAAGGVGLVTRGSSGAGNLVGKLASSSSPTTTVKSDPAKDQYAGFCGSAPRKALCVLTISNASVKEPKAGAACVNAVFTVHLTTKSDQTITVQYKTRDGSAVAAEGDYVAKTGTVVFPPGATTEYITIQVCHDASVPNTAEKFYVDLFGPSPGAKLGAASTGTGTIDQ